MSAIFIVIPILTVLMYELGLKLQYDDFRRIASQPKGIIAGLLGQIVFLPLAAYCICALCGLPVAMSVGLMLLACCPGGSSSNVFSMLAGGNVALSVSLTAFSSIITLFTMPLILAWFTTGGNYTSQISLPTVNLLIQNVVFMLAPILCGYLTRYFAPSETEKIDKVLSKCAFPALMLLAAVFFVGQYRAIIDNFASIGLSVCLLMAAAMIGGSLIARSFRLDTSDRRTIVIETGMQNAAQAIAVAGSPFVFNNAEFAIPAIIYALVMNVGLLSYIAIIKKHATTQIIK